MWTEIFTRDEIVRTNSIWNMDGIQRKLMFKQISNLTKKSCKKTLCASAARFFLRCRGEEKLCKQKADGAGHNSWSHRTQWYRNTYVSTKIWLRLARDGRFKSVIILPLITASSQTSLKAGNLVGEAGFIRSVLCLLLWNNLAEGRGW